MDGGGTDDPLARFGARRRELRRARALSQFARSERAGLDHSYVSDCERGRLSITPRNIHTLAAAPGVEPVALFRSPADTPEDGEGDGAPRTPRRPRPPDPTAAAPPPPSPGRPPKRPGRYGRAVIVGVRPSVPRALLKASIAATWHRRVHHRLTAAAYRATSAALRHLAGGHRRPGHGLSGERPPPHHAFAHQQTTPLDFN